MQGAPIRGSPRWRSPSRLLVLARRLPYPPASTVRNDASYTKLRATVDTCAAEWVTDPAGLLMIDATPYVLVMEGATDQAFIDALRTSLYDAAGN